MTASAARALLVLLLALSARLPAAQEDAAPPPLTKAGPAENPVAPTDRRIFLGPTLAGQQSEPLDDDTSVTPPRSILIGPYVPKGSLDAPDRSPASPADRDAGQDASGEDIAVDRLDSLDPSAIGVWLDGDTPPFPVTLWQGSRRAMLAALLPALPSDSISPEIRALSLRLLLSPAAIPSGRDDRRLGDLLAVRLGRLAAAGAVEELIALSDRVPPPARTMEIEALRADALLAFGDYQRACEIARDAIMASGATRWLRMVALCDALDGNRAGAGLRLGLLEESGESDFAFSTLIDALSNEVAGTPRPLDASVFAERRTLDPVLFALARLVRAPLPEPLLAAAPPLLLSELARTPHLPAEARLPLAEKAAALGRLPAATLAALYDSLSFSDAERAAIFASIDYDRTLLRGDAPSEALAATEGRVEGARLTALLYHLASKATDNGERLRWIEIGIEQALRHDRLAVTAAVYERLISAIPAADLHAGYAYDIGRLHLLNGKPDEALAWLAAAEQAAGGGNADAAQARDRLWPLMLLADTSGLIGHDAARLDAWWRSFADQPSAESLGDASRFALILAAFGHHLPDALELELMSAPPVRSLAPSPLAWKALLLATQDDRLGDAMLSGLVAIGNGAPYAIDPALLQAFLSSLISFGYETDARRLAIEVLAGS